eukprot:scaffold2595_cov107-Cylindrotheca_fusiformis.AAC.3
MIFTKTSLIGLLSLMATSVESFVVTHPSRTAISPASINPSTSTCLHAEDDNEAGTEAETEAASSSSETDILSSPAFLKRKVEVLKSDIEKAEQDIQAAQEQAEAGKAEWGPQLEDLQREYKNIQERMSTQSKAGDEMAAINVVREMLELLDNFDRAFGVIKPENDAEAAIEAEYKALYQSIVDTFDKLGVEQVATVGTDFDYEVHQAIAQRPVENFEEGVVCEEYQKGFKMGDTLIRAAMVVVAA